MFLHNGISIFMYQSHVLKVKSNLYDHLVLVQHPQANRRRVSPVQRRWIGWGASCWSQLFGDFPLGPKLWNLGHFVRHALILLTVKKKYFFLTLDLASPKPLDFSCPQLPLFHFVAQPSSTRLKLSSKLLTSSAPRLSCSIGRLRGIG